MLWFKKPGKKKIESNEQFEQCVICGNTTRYMLHTPIEDREFYIIGCGQLCFDCYKKTCEDIPLTPSESEMRYLIQQCRNKGEK